MLLSDPNYLQATQPTLTQGGAGPSSQAAVRALSLSTLITHTFVVSVLAGSMFLRQLREPLCIVQGSRVKLAANEREVALVALADEGWLEVCETRSNQHVALLYAIRALHHAPAKFH